MVIAQGVFCHFRAGRERRGGRNRGGKNALTPFPPSVNRRQEPPEKISSGSGRTDFPCGTRSFDNQVRHKPDRLRDVEEIRRRRYHRLVYLTELLFRVSGYDAPFPFPVVPTLLCFSPCSLPCTQSRGICVEFKPICYSWSWELAKSHAINPRYSIRR